MKYEMRRKLEKVQGLGSWVSGAKTVKRNPDPGSHEHLWNFPKKLEVNPLCFLCFLRNFRGKYDTRRYPIESGEKQ